MKNLAKQSYWRKAKLASLILQLTPFIKMIGLNGSLARGEATKTSDIDFFIVAKKGRIWTARAFSTLIMAIFGLKRYQNKIAGRVCLNCYQTEDYLKVAPANAKNALDYAHLLPFWQANRNFHRFQIANTWISQFSRHFVFVSYRPSLTEKLIAIFLTIFRVANEFLFDLIFADWGEHRFKTYQITRIANDPRSQNAPAGAIFISDRELRFHLPKLKNLTKIS